MICKPPTLLNFQYFNYNYGKLYCSKIFPELIKNFPELNKIFPELKFYKLQKVQDQRPGIKIQYLQKLQILHVGIVYLNMQISIKLYQVQIADSDSRCLSKQIDFPTTKTNFSYNNTQKSSTTSQPSDNILQVPKATYQQSLHYSISVSEQPPQASLLIA